MSMKKWIGMGLCGLIAGTGVSFAQGDMAAEIDEAFQAGTLKGSLGAMYLENAPNGFNNNVLGTGFIELEYITGEMQGLQLGVDVLGVGEIYTHNMDFDVLYNEGNDLDAALRELYIKYNTMNSSVVIGRHTPMAPPVLEGDSFEGLTLNIGEWEDMGVKVVASVFNRGVRSVKWNEEGITDWLDVDDNGGKDHLWSVMAEFAVMEDMVNLKPYILHQGDFATVYGVQAGMTYEMEGAQLGGTADYYFVSEDTGIAGMDDSDAWKLYLYGEMEGTTAGIGYYAYSDEVNQLEAGNSWLDDLEALDDTFAYINNFYFTGQDSKTWWVDFGYDWEGLKLAAQWGNYEDDTAVEFDQLMLKAGYDVTQSFEVAAKYVDVDGKQNMNDTGIYKVYGVYKF